MSNCRGTATCIARCREALLWLHVARRVWVPRVPIQTCCMRMFCCHHCLIIFLKSISNTLSPHPRHVSAKFSRHQERAKAVERCTMHYNHVHVGHVVLDHDVVLPPHVPPDVRGLLASKKPYTVVYFVYACNIRE